MKKKLFTLAKILVSLCLLVLLFSRINFGELLTHFEHFKVGYALIGLGLLVLQSVLSSLKWKIILQADGSDAPFIFLWKTYLIGGFLSLFLPSSIGGDFYRIYALRNANKNLSKTTSSVLFDRISGLFALISIAFIASMFLPGNRYSWISLAVYLAGIFLFVLLTSDWAIALLGRIHFKGFSFVLKILRSFNSYRKDLPRMAAILLIAFLFQFNIVVVNKAYSLALGIDVPFSKLLVVVPLVYLSEAIPISINGLGVRESAFAFFFNLIGSNREEGLAVSLLTVFMRYIANTVGGVLFLMNNLRSNRKQVSTEEGSQPTPTYPPSA